MHPTIYKAIEKILEKANVKGKVLEVGAVPSERSILCSDKLSGADEKIGINLNGPYDYQDFKILSCNANDMSIFEDAHFDCVLCNAMLEHDKFFWKTVSEIHRVLKPGGFAVLGTPGYAVTKQEVKIKNFFRRRFIRKLKRPTYLEDLSFCFRIHNEPGDYYRFSEQTFEEVFFDGFENVNVSSHMFPPRILGYGYKK